MAWLSALATQQGTICLLAVKTVSSEISMHLYSSLGCMRERL